MLTRNETLKFLRSLIVALSLIEEIFVIIPSYASLIHHVELFINFLKDQQHKQ